MFQQVTSTTNHYIDELRQSLQRNRRAAADWLVVAHDDARVLTQLDAAFPESVLAVLVVPQGRWQADAEKMSEAVEWAVEELGVQGVLLIGHSQGGVTEEPVRLLGGRALAKGAGDPPPACAPLTDRVKSAQSRAARVQEHFAEQVERLSRMPVIESRLIRNQMQLHGLFYRGESGTFCLYDRRQRRFRALLDDVVAA
jgi:carbonic anhydrase